MIPELDFKRMARFWRYTTFLGVVLSILAIPADQQSIPAELHGQALWVRIAEIGSFALAFAFFYVTRDRLMPRVSNFVIIALSLMVAVAMAFLELFSGGPQNLYFCGIIMIMALVVGYGYLSPYALLATSVTAFASYFVIVGTQHAASKAFGNLLFVALFLCIILFFVGRHLQLIRRERDETVFEKTALIGQLKAANEAKTRFLANVTHDLRNPLTIIKMAGQFLMKKGGHDVESYARDIRTSVTDMEGMVEDLIDTAQTEINVTRVPLDQSVDLARHLDDVVASLALKYEDADIDFLPHEVKGEIIGEDVTIRRILFNIVDNSIKHSVDKKVSIALEASPEGLSVVVSNRSERPIPKGEKIFEAFERLDTEASVPGIGLGLGIARSLVEKVHGSLRHSYDEATSMIDFELQFARPDGFTG